MTGKNCMLIIAQIVLFVIDLCSLSYFFFDLFKYCFLNKLLWSRPLILTH